MNLPTVSQRPSNIGGGVPTPVPGPSLDQQMTHFYNTIGGDFIFGTQVGIYNPGPFTWGSATNLPPAATPRGNERSPAVPSNNSHTENSEKP